MTDKEANELASKVMGWEPIQCKYCDLSEHWGYDFIESFGPTPSHIPHNIWPDWNTDSVLVKALIEIVDKDYWLQIEGSNDDNNSSWKCRFGLGKWHKASNPHLALRNAIIELGSIKY
jgi:hypothetical protein